MNGLKNGRVVVVALPGEGHLSPMMHLTGHLARQGFSINFIFLADSIGTYDAMVNSAWPPTGLDISLHHLDCEVPYPAHAVTEQRLDLALLHTHCRLYQHHLRQFVQNLGSSVSCIISDYQLSWCVDVASSLGISSALLFTGCITWTWFELNLPRLLEAGLIPMQQELMLEPEQDCVVLEEPRLMRSDIPWHYWDEKEWQEYTARYNSPVFHKVTWLLSASSEELEKSMLERVRSEVGGGKNNIIPVGPLFLLSDDPNSAVLRDFDVGCLNWLDKQPPSSVLYIAFGSLATLSMQQLEELAAGIEASRHKFLLVARSSSDSEINDFYRQFSKRNEDQGLVVGWSPQAQLLSHNSVGAFLSHCGWNSTVEGVVNGKPLLCWPCRYDQNINRRLIVDDWKVGIGFNTGDNKLVSRNEVERVIRLVMEEDLGSVLRERVKELSSRVRDAVVSLAGSSHNNLQKFIESL